MNVDYKKTRPNRMYNPVPTVPLSNLTTVNSELTEFQNNGLYLPRRYLVCFLTFTGMFFVQALRVNLSVAVVVMTIGYPIVLNNGTTIQVKEFDWNSKEKGYILSSYFYGYVISEFPSGWLAGRFGGRNIFGLEMFFATICSFLIPTVAGYGLYAIFMCRSLLGIFEGGALSSACAIWTQWAPPEEKTLLLTISLMGGSVSNVVCFFVYGILATTWGWRALFYVPGFATLFWCIVWFACVKNRPEEDKNMSENELQYIIRSRVGGKSLTKVIYPWKSIVTSSKVWSLIYAHFCNAWIFFFLSMELPSYFNDVWKINVKDSGFFLLISFGAAFIMDIICSITVDYLIARKKYSITLVRKSFYAIATIGSAVFLCLIGNSYTASAAIVFVTLENCVYSFFFGSTMVSPMDLAPAYASVIMGMVTTFGSVAAIIVPLLTGYAIPNQSREEWIIPFVATSAVSISGAVIYSVFGSNEIQNWALDKIESDDENEAPGNIN